MVDGALLHRTISAYARLDEDRAAIAEDQAQVIKDAVEAGLDKKALKALLRELRRNDATATAMERAMLDEYREVYATWEATPLGSFAKGSPEPQDGKSQMKRAREAKPGELVLVTDGDNVVAVERAAGGK
jgi:uncharacterized protein (UPF0335 family)